MTTVWKRRSVVFGFWGVLIAAFSASSPFGLRFIEIFPLLVAIPAAILSYLVFKDPTPEEDEEVKGLLDAISEFETITEEHLKVIKEYEDIFDAQLVELPCVCGGNTFRGLFSPNTENEVQCEKCKNNYRVTIAYDTVLLSEPLDQKSIDKTLDQV